MHHMLLSERILQGRGGVLAGQLGTAQKILEEMVCLSWAVHRADTFFKTRKKLCSHTSGEDLATKMFSVIFVVGKTASWR